MRARTFMQVCIGILALAAAYHLGANSARAQATGNPVAAAWAFNYGGSTQSLVVTANGDVCSSGGGAWTYTTNVFTGSTTPVHATSFGALKVKYR